MGHRLPDEVVHGIRVRIEAGEAVPAIAEAVMVGKKRLYVGDYGQAKTNDNLVALKGRIAPGSSSDTVSSPTPRSGRSPRRKPSPSGGPTFSPFRWHADFASENFLYRRTPSTGSQSAPL